MSSLQNTAKTKIANALKSLQNMDTKTERSGQKGTEKNIGYSGASQDCVPLKDIVNGIYITDDNRYLAVVEILPTKYDLKSPQKQEYLLKLFGDLFRKKPYKWQMKTMNDIGTCKDLIKNIETNCPKQDDPNVRESMHAYIKFINSLIDRGSVVTRFFYIWEYHNTDLDKPTHEEKVQQMIEIRNEIVAGFNSVEDGNIALYHENESLFVTDFIYNFFNRRTYEIETLQERYNRMSADYERFNKKTGANKKLTYKDLVASKGIYFIDSSCMVMDGMYYSFIGIMGDSWPCDEAVPAGWLNTFSYGAMVDIDVIGKILPEAATKLLLSKYNDLTEERARSALNKGRKKGLTLADNFNNNKAVLNAMKKGEDLYDVAIILTVRASTKKLLKSYMRQIKKHLTKIATSENNAVLGLNNGYKSLYAIPYDKNGLTIIQQMIKPEWREKMKKRVLPDHDHVTNNLGIEADGIRGAEIAFLFCIPDLSRLCRFLAALAFSAGQITGEMHYVIYCFDFQKELVEQLNDGLAEIRTVGLEKAILPS